MFYDHFSYKGTCIVEADEIVQNIILARMRQYRLNEYIRFEENKLYIDNKDSNWYTKLELVMDLLLFINKYATLSIDIPITVEHKDTGQIDSIFQHNNKLYYYSVQMETWKDNSIPLLTKFFRCRSQCNYQFTYLSDYLLNKEETREMEVKGIIIPLFEPFMKQKLNIDEKKYIAFDNNLILPGDLRKSTCFACEHRLQNISNRGCESCIPKIIKKS